MFSYLYIAAVFSPPSFLHITDHIATVLLLLSLLSLAHCVAAILFSQPNIIAACNCASSRTDFVFVHLCHGIYKCMNK